MDVESHVPPHVIHRAAIKWCGQKDRETFPEDVEYFKANWWALPGLKKFVIAELPYPITPAQPDSQ